MSYQLLLTDAGAAKVAAAANAGGLIHLTDFVIGQGVNVDFSTRLDKQVLVSKRYQGKIESVAPRLGNARQYEITCIVPPDVGGFTIREFGLIDDTGVLIWVGSLPEVQKPDATSTAAVDYRIKAVVQIDNPQVSIVIDVNTVTATQSWVSANFAAIGHNHQNMLERLKKLEDRVFEAIAVGGIYATAKLYANGQDVHTDLGYGVWALYAQGKVLAGYSTIASDDAKYKTMGNVFEIGSEIANQKAIVAQFWKRLPNGYIEPTYNIYWTADAEGTNKVTEFAETDNIYLWIEASNLTNSYPISSINVLAIRHADTDAVASFNNSTVHPSALTNGKNLVYALNGNDQGYFTSDIDLSLQVNFVDTAINQAKTLESSTVVRDTVANTNTPIPLPYNGVKFEIYIRNDGGKIKVEPKILENNSPYIVRAGDPKTEGRQAIVITNLPLNLSNAFRYFTIEQNPLNGYSGCAMGSYKPSTGEGDFLVLTQKAFDDFASGLIPDGTLINTVKLTYTP